MKLLVTRSSFIRFAIEQGDGLGWGVACWVMGTTIRKQRMAGFSISDGLLVAATLLGPVLAVQAQKFVEMARERRSRKLQLFSILMATRATRLANNHVEALNAIELVFDPKKRREKAVIDALRIYYDKLNEGVGDQADPHAIRAWTEKCQDLFIELLFAMSTALGHAFDRVQLKRGIYYPVAHGEANLAQRVILQGLSKVLSGQQAIPMDVVKFPVSEEAIDLQKEVQKGLLKTFSGEGALHVSMEQAGKKLDH
jgi:hypothetical protein